MTTISRTLPPHFRARLPVASRRALARSPQYLGTLGINAQTQSAATYAATGAKVGSAILPGIGTAVGAIVGAVYGWAGGKQPSHAEQTWDGYKSQAGTGLLVTLSDSDEAEVWKGAYDTNNKFFNFGGIKSRRAYIEWLVDLLQKGIASGAILPTSTPKQIVDNVVYPAMKAGGSHLNDSVIMHNFLGDVVSRLFAGIPMHNERTGGVALQPVTMTIPANWGAASSTTQNVPPTVTTAQVPTTTSTPPAASDPVQVMTSTPTSTTPTNAPPVSSDLSSYIAALQAQGASNQQMMDAALSKLQSQGVAITPQVQASVADAVTKTGSTPLWEIGAFAGGALLLIYIVSSRRSRR